MPETRGQPASVTPAQHSATGDARRASRGVAATPVIDIDGNGSPVSLPEVDWLVCFVPGRRRQWWHRFAHEKHKHVFAMRRLDDGNWLLVEPWWRRLMVSVLTHAEATGFLHWGANGHVLKVREKIPGRGSQIRGWSNCAVLVAFLLGRSYWTWTPHGLYRRLMADIGVESVDPMRYLGEPLRVIGNEAPSARPESTVVPSTGMNGPVRAVVAPWLSEDSRYKQAHG
jgi:hypothetical protein